MKKIFLLVAVFFLSLVITGCGGSNDDPDTASPTITAVYPLASATGVVTSSIIRVAYGEAMNQTSAEGAFSMNPSVTGTFSWRGNVMTFSPDTDLDEATVYVITVGTGAKDLAGNLLVSVYTWSWRTALPYKVINLQSDFTAQTSNSGVIPSLDGQYIFWWDGTAGENPSNYHLYRVKISDLSSQTIWTNRTLSNIYDDGVNSWVGNDYPYEAAKISNSSISYVTNNVPGGHNISLNGNRLAFAYVYFGTSSSQGIGYWNRSNDTTGLIPDSAANIYQSAVIGNKIYFPRGSTMNSSGIMVVDAVNNPTALETTLLPGNPAISNANDIYTDDIYLYVPNGTTNQIQKIDPTGAGSIVATFSPDVSFTNPVIIGNYIYSGVSNNKNVYIMDKTTGSVVIKDCSAYLPTPVGSPKWDFANDGVWYGPQGALTTERIAYFIPRSIIDNL
ncbi:MAG: Ig-like domain-containing protein [Desulfobacterales bacterium]|nr:Ig-like domain-containing protein [Desulfobacterales bacterium]